MEEFFIERGESRRRVLFIYSFFLLAFFLAVLRLWDLQVRRGSYYRRWAKKNSIQSLPIKACRGNIYDAEGRLIATTGPSFNIYAITSGIAKEKVKESIESICILLNLEKEPLVRALCKKRSMQPILIVKDAEKTALLSVAERIESFAGIHIEVVHNRHYPYKKVFASTLGYMNEEGWGLGIEKVFDQYLRGEDGRMLLEVDAKGKRLGIIKKREAEKGCNLHLTVDMALQEYAQTLLEGRQGVILIMDVRDGSILSLVCAESFDPNIFIKEDEESIERLLSSPASPLFNKATCGLYPPGSAFKLVLFLAALEKGISPTTKYTCKAKFLIGNRVFKCWKKEGHGSIALFDALAQSCNIYFYKLGKRLGPKHILHSAKRFGFAKKTELSFSSEKRGCLPSRVRFLGELANLSIGQGEILCTPIQMAVFTSALANGGKLLRPYIVKYIEKEGRVIKSFNRKVTGSIQVKKKNLYLLKEAMHNVIKKGTGVLAYIKGLSICGKTGTAQNPHGEDHAWFLCFFPKERPLYAVVVFVEKGGSGGIAAAPIARRVIKFMKNKNML